MRKLFVLFALLFAVPALAQSQLKVADGSSSGTYAKMLGEIKEVCSDTIALVEEGTSKGAIDNLQMLVDNQVSGAFMHSDVIYFRAMNEDLSKLKTLIALYPEDVHVLVKRDSGLKAGTLFNKQPVVFNSVEDLAGYKVGAAGGGTITAQVIRLQAQIAYDFVPFNSGKEVMDALAANQIQAAIFVGGAPLPNLKDLGPEYKLVGFNANTVDKLKSVYRPTTISYSKMQSTGVRTVAPDALFVVREYKTERMVGALANLRACFYKNLPDLQETPGKHPKWQVVDPENHGKWPWYQLPETTATKKK
jgi:TRAP-type uncharacterized transport system substrate-binding protein